MVLIGFGEHVCFTQRQGYYHNMRSACTNNVINKCECICFVADYYIAHLAHACYVENVLLIYHVVHPTERRCANTFLLIFIILFTCTHDNILNRTLSYKCFHTVKCVHNIYTARARMMHGYILFAQLSILITTGSDQNKVTCTRQTYICVINKNTMNESNACK